MTDDRKDFLVQMYNQMFNDINRHILVVWQSVGVVVGAFAVLALAEKKVMPLDLAVSIIVLLTAWLLAHLLDASYWYNRNLVIIANIERQFLSQDDLTEIHYYFGKHRPKNPMLTHLKIQCALGAGIAIIVIIYHLSERVLPGLSLPMSDFQVLRALPYVLTIGAAFYLWKIRRARNEAYEEFLKNSPGKAVDASKKDYGIGHGFRPKDVAAAAYAQQISGQPPAP